MSKNHFSNHSNRGHSASTGSRNPRMSHRNGENDPNSGYDDTNASDYNTRGWGNPSFGNAQYGNDPYQNSGDRDTHVGTQYDNSHGNSDARSEPGSRDYGNRDIGSRHLAHPDSNRSARDSDQDYRYDRGARPMNSYGGDRSDENGWSGRNFNRQSMNVDPYASRSAPDVLRSSGSSYGNVGYNSPRDSGRYPGAGYTSSPSVGNDLGNDYGNRYGSRSTWNGMSDAGTSMGSNLSSNYGYGSSTSTSGSNAMGEGRHFGKGPKGYKRSDERIKEEISDRLWHHAHIDASDLTIEVKDGAVTLTGTVDDRSTKRMVESEIENLSGVEDIHNQIKVKKNDVNSSAQSMSDATDSRNSKSGDVKAKGQKSSPDLM